MARMRTLLLHLGSEDGLALAVCDGIVLGQFAQTHELMKVALVRCDQRHRDHQGMRWLPGQGKAFEKTLPKGASADTEAKRCCTLPT